MKYKVGDKVRIIVPKDVDEWPGFDKEMGILGQNNPQGVVITRARISNGKQVYSVYDSKVGYHWDFLESWLAPSRIHSSGGNL